MFGSYATLADVQIALEEIHEAQTEAIAQAELVLKGMRAEAKTTYSKLLMLDELQGKGDYIEAYPKPKRVTRPVDEVRNWNGPGHDPSGNQY